MSLKVIVAGMGVQGSKRQHVAGKDVIATVDPFATGVDYKDVRNVPLDAYEAALICTPDEPKVELIKYLLSNRKHVLVEKPLFSENDKDIEAIEKLARTNGVVCYTAYNHRFEPHFIKLRNLMQSGVLGNIYSLRMFYGNGTARLVRDSAWRDTGAGVLPDLGSHLLDTLRFWFGKSYTPNFDIHGAYRHENKSLDHVIIGSKGIPAVQLEMTILSWRNHFTCDVFAEKGSAHIESLCKWGPSSFTQRTRLLPSGRPPEVSITLIQDDPTWSLEYSHFINLCKNSISHTVENDIWINHTLRSLYRRAYSKDDPHVSP
jgi:scyllo-inositol 2-dehydrogenase (NADP+)